VPHRFPPVADVGAIVQIPSMTDIDLATDASAVLGAIDRCSVSQMSLLCGLALAANPRSARQHEGA